MRQTDSGPWGNVWGVNPLNQIWCRVGITWNNPQGKGWRRLPGKLKYVSVGEFGPWGVNKFDNIFFRYGVSSATLQGTKMEIHSNMKLNIMKRII